MRFVGLHTASFPGLAYHRTVQKVASAHAKCGACRKRALHDEGYIALCKISQDHPSTCLTLLEITALGSNIRFRINLVRASPCTIIEFHENGTEDSTWRRDSRAGALYGYFRL